MKKVLFVCSAGMSSSLIADKMTTEFKNEGEETVVEAYSVSEMLSKITDCDYLIAGPQLRFMEAKLVSTAKEYGKPFYLIDVKEYGRQDAKSIIGHMREQKEGNV